MTVSFDSISHSNLRSFLDQRVTDGVVRRMIDKWLKAGVLEDGTTSRTTEGTPQGGVISPLLANIYLHYVLDEWFETAARPCLKGRCILVRYADDAVILCRSEADAQRAYRWLQERAQALKLNLHPVKSRLVELGEGRDGIDFLGFHIRLVQSWKHRRWYCQMWPSRRAMAVIRAKIKAITAPRSRLKRPIGALVAELNPVLRGWGNHFRWGNSSRHFNRIDSYVHERLALFDSKKRQRSGRRWGQVNTYAWVTRLGVHRLSGTIRYYSRAATATM